uniref:Uncharacterized protein n=1 Tax=Vitis vinifera TaxID=29760 RepID=F6GUW3_VITVI
MALSQGSRGNNSRFMDRFF